MGPLEAWAQIAQALKTSGNPQDRTLAENITTFMRESSYLQEVARRQRREVGKLNKDHQVPVHEANVSKGSHVPDVER